MNQNEIKELIEFLVEKDIAEFELERGDVKLRIKRAQVVAGGSGAANVASSNVAPAASGAAGTGSSQISDAVVSSPAAESDRDIYVIKSPIVGTFYEAASPGAPAFVKQGDTVSVGQVLCIVEAMKLMNEIESEASGLVVNVLVSNGQPVEYGQPLFKIRTK
jgi:acetyl-CoA carboxylase biotin carboxyl carrier protein